jgi:hypothetical protein
VVVVRERQPIIYQRVFNVLFDPVAEFGVLGLPFGQPGDDVAADLGELAPVIGPSPSTATAISTAWLTMTPASRTSS